MDDFDEGVELAIRSLQNDDQWIPLKFYTLTRHIEPNLRRTSEDINIGAVTTNSMLSLRGYQVGINDISGSFRAPTNVTEYICDERFFQEGVQFRWLQTVFRQRPEDSNEAMSLTDLWLIDNVMIAVHNEPCYRETVMSDNFNGQNEVK